MNTLQQAGVVNKAPKRGVHRKRRERAPWPGMMLHQDGSQHQWVTGQYGEAMAQLGIEMIPAYSPEARGRSERAFRTHQDRLVRALEVAGMTNMAAANRYLQETYRPRYNAEFA